MLISSVSYSLEWPFFNYVWNGLNYQQVCNFSWLHYNTSQISQFALRFVHNGVLGTVSEYHPLSLKGFCCLIYNNIFNFGACSAQMVTQSAPAASLGWRIIALLVARNWEISDAWL
jgi:hypothetical protein